MARNHRRRAPRHSCLWVFTVFAIFVLANMIIQWKIASEMSILTIGASLAAGDSAAIAPINTDEARTGNGSVAIKRRDAGGARTSVSRASMGGANSDAMISMLSQSSQLSQPRRKWAYVYLVAGCDSSNPGNHLGMLYNVVVAARVLRNAGSKADVVVMVEMFHAAPNERLLPQEERILTAAGVIIKYMERSTVKMSFHETTLRKFEVLKLTEYSRVMYMDADVVPFCSMDDLFDLSEPDPQDLADRGLTRPVLRENVILAWIIEPATAGFFMLRPGPGFYDEIQEIIARQEKEATLIADDLKFDRTKGWGHVFEGGDDVWTSLRGAETREAGKNKRWDWHCDYGDQGLLYYWTKYHRRDVSIVIGDTVEHWVDRDGAAVLDHRDSHVLDKCACAGDQATHVRKRHVPFDARPYTSFHHFTGKSKPWLEPGKTAIRPGKAAQAVHVDVFWWQSLRDASLDLNFTVQHRHLAQAPVYGLFNTHDQLNAKITQRRQQLGAGSTLR